MTSLKKGFFVGFLALFLALNLHFSAFGQNAAARPAKSGGFEELKLESRLMKRAMPYRVILPAGYQERTAEKFPVVYLLHGLTGHYNNWTDLTKLVEYARGYDYIIVTPEGGDGWYTDSATVPDDKYESYIISELIPEIEKRFRALPARESRAVAGLSMGGYGSLKYGLKYPEKFVLVGSFSGALRAAEWTGKELGGGWKALTDSIQSTFAGADSATRRENDIFKLLQAKTPEQAKTLPFFYLDCGTEDFLLQQSRDFTLLLSEKKIPHEFRELPGGHEWKYWDAQVEEFLEVSRKYIRPDKAKND